MALNGHGSEGRPRSPASYAEQRLNQLQAGLVAAARLWAATEVRAAIAYQLNDPLTALLLHLQGLKDEEKHSVVIKGRPTSEVIDLALHEVMRICDVLEPMGLLIERPTDAEGTAAWGRDAIESWAKNAIAEGHRRALPDAGNNVLTPRELEVLDLIIDGTSNKNGAYSLGITKRTFEVHRAHIMEKFGAKNAADLVRMVLSRNGGDA